MTPTRRFALAVAGMALLTTRGAVGYMQIEHMSVLDAFYMSVITISTVGFGEVKPGGAARIGALIESLAAQPASSRLPCRGVHTRHARRPLAQRWARRRF